MSGIVKKGRDMRRSLGLSSGGGQGVEGADNALVDVVNSALGTEQRVIRNPDGSIKEVQINQLPLTAEEQRLKDTLEQITQGSLDRLQSLAGTTSADFLDDPQVQQFVQFNQALLERSQGRVSQQQEEILAQRGIAEGTSATEQRAALQGQFVEQQEQAGLQALNFANQVRDQRLGEQISLLNASNALQTGQQSQLATSISGAQAAAGLGLQQAQLGLQQSNLQTQLDQQRKQQQQQLIGTAIGAAAAFSDERLKENIVKVGELQGLNLYKFNYIGNPSTIIGVIAQEVQKFMPEAVHEIDGFLAVDYNKLFGEM